MNFEELVFIKIGIANSVTKLLVTKKYSRMAEGFNVEGSVRCLLFGWIIPKSPYNINILALRNFV